jgi:hypothetical protein
MLMLMLALAALAALEWCDPAALETAALAAVLGVKGTYHARREVLRCIVALAKQPKALQALQREVQKTLKFKSTFKDWVEAVENGDDCPDLEAIVLAKRVRAIV